MTVTVSSTRKPVAEADSEAPGTVIDGKYVVEGVLGRGGMGVVVAAHHNALGERVALKLLRADRTSPDVAERLRREARISIRLKSQHVARVMDVGALPSGAPYLVMEYLEGEDLAKIVRRAKTLEIGVAVDAVLQACEAVAEAHAMGVVHRDLKPSNLFVTRGPDGAPLVKVLDFGIAKAVDMGMGAASLTQTSTVMGSPLYMAPEQIRGSRDVDHRADVWSLGVILYELLTGEPPFTGPSTATIFGAIISDPAAPVATLRPDVPPALDAAILACLEKDPVRRTPDVRSLAAALREHAPYAARASLDRIAKITPVRDERSSSKPPPATASVGAVLDRKYQLIRQLGEGGMGAVYEGRHLVTGRRVAVKVISQAVLDKGGSIVDRFQREARATGLTETEHIVQVLDSGADPVTGCPYMVMEFLRGEDVAQLVRRTGPLVPDAALRLTQQACAGLAKAHHAGVVHRDIKPGNLFLSRRDDGTVIVKLLDFGVAKLRRDELTAETAKLTRTGSVLGSPLYMSPEQAKGSKTTDHRTDLWSLGVVLYELCAGITPHGHCETLGELILAICGQPARPVQDLAPWVPPSIAAVIHRALEIDPDKRYANAIEMIEALRALLPAGAALDEGMLEAVSPDLRGHVAPRLAMTPATVVDLPGFPRQAPATPVPAATGPGLSTSQPPPPAKRGPGGTVVAIGFAAGALIAFAGFRYLTGNAVAPVAASTAATQDSAPIASISGAPVRQETPPPASVAEPAPSASASAAPSARAPAARPPLVHGAAPTATPVATATAVASVEAPRPPPVASKPPSSASPLATSTDEFGGKRP